MKVKVIKDSVIYKGKIYKLDDEFELKDVLAQSLMESGYVTAFNEGEFTDIEDDSQEEQETIEGNLSIEQLQEMKYSDLKKLASDLKVGATGTKEELIEKIASVNVEVEAPYDDEIIEEDEDGELPQTGMPDDE